MGFCEIHIYMTYCLVLFIKIQNFLNSISSYFLYQKNICGRDRQVFADEQSYVKGYYLTFKFSSQNPGIYIKCDSVKNYFI